MPSTYLSLHYHIVFSTKNREAFIQPEWRIRLHDYLGGTIRGLGGHPETIGGIVDHVHLLISLKATHSIADTVREVKKISSSWVHEEIGMRQFAWQEGYAAFTVSATARDGVRHYISNQEEHHRFHVFSEELTAMLNKAGIQFDPKYFD